MDELRQVGAHRRRRQTRLAGVVMAELDSHEGDLALGSLLPDVLEREVPEA